MAAEESFEKAKQLLLGAVDTVLHAATHLRANDTGAGDGPSSTPRPSTHRPIVRDSEMSSPYSSQSETSTTQKAFTGCTSKDVSVGSNRFAFSKDSSAAGHMRTYIQSRDGAWHFSMHKVCIKLYCLHKA